MTRDAKNIGHITSSYARQGDRLSVLKARYESMERARGYVSPHAVVHPLVFEHIAEIDLKKIRDRQRAQWMDEQRSAIRESVRVQIDKTQNPLLYAWKKLELDTDKWMSMGFENVHREWRRKHYPPRRIDIGPKCRHNLPADHCPYLLCRMKG